MFLLNGQNRTILLKNAQSILQLLFSLKYYMMEIEKENLEM